MIHIVIHLLKVVKILAEIRNKTLKAILFFLGHIMGKDGEGKLEFPLIISSVFRFLSYKGWRMLCRKKKNVVYGHSHLYPLS